MVRHVAEDKTAPAGLELVRRFVNTRDLEHGVDSLAAPADLAGWLREQRLTAENVSVAAFERGLAVREALRSLLLGNAGETADLGIAGGTLDEMARRARVRLRFTPEGGFAVAPMSGGVDGALGLLLARAAAAMADGTWARLKVCRDRGCGRAFYDRTKNRSGVWCSMDVCGNRNKARVYRKRHTA